MEAVFAQEYFLDEVRDGFYVPSIMKRVWAEQITMLVVINEICERHNIRWYAAWGTLLGAVRHGGYIPWDDDVDIHMFREDYNRFAEIAEKELPAGYGIKSIWNDTEQYSDILRINNTKGEALNQDFLNKHNGCFYGCGIDVFPIDIIEVSEEESRELRDKLLAINYLKSYALAGADKEKKEKQRELADKYGVSFEKNIPISNACMRKWVELLEGAASKQSLQELFALCGENCGEIFGETEKKSSSAFLNESVPYSSNESNNQAQKEVYTITANGWSFGAKGYSFDWFKEIEWIPFENTVLPVPSKWDEVLTEYFGDYRTPKKGVVAHTFPFFCDSQKKLWKDAPELKFMVDRGKKDSRIVRTKKYSTIDNYISNNIFEKLVLFLPVSISDWAYMKPIYDYMVDEQHASCVVIPIPYMLRNNDRSFGEIRWDAADFESLPDECLMTKAGNEVRFAPYEKYDYGNPRPDAIVFSDPYDGYNGGYSVHPFFYSENLRKMTDRLIYVQCFEVDLSQIDAATKWSTEYFIKQPGLAYANEIIVNDSVSKEVYEQIISEWIH